jgi:hypothetical protein
MARWFYNRPSENCDVNEIKVAKLLARLGKRWTIRWGYYYTDNKGVRREGDFLIFDPMHGLLVLEVKGHRFRQFAPTGAWEGDPEKSRDHPLYQLDQEHAGVIRALDEVESGWHPVAKALCLPNELIPEGQKTFRDIDRNLFVDRRDLDRIETIFGRFFGGQQPRDLNRHREVFLKAYGKGGGREELKHFIDHNEVLFRKQLTRQYQLLDILGENRQLLIEGGAGTGKTWHAVEQAVRLAEQGEGAQVLLLCYNIALGRFLRDLVSRRKPEQGEITVFHWEELADHLLRECGMPNQAPGPEASREEKMRYYDQELPDLLLACVREAEFVERLPRFDALVVDEAQDHDTAFAGGGEPGATDAVCGWWAIYFALLRDRTNAPMALFFDQAQRPPFRGSGGFDVRRIADQLSQPAFARLPHALRYTRPVFEFLETLRAPGTEGLVARLSEPDDLPEGPEVVSSHLPGATETEVQAEVGKIVFAWVEAGYCRPEEVLVLHTRTDLKKSALGACETLAGLPLVEYGLALEPNAKVIRHLSINRAKGLDALAVIMVGAAPFATITKVDDQYTYFMGASRAKQLLAVVEG